MTYNVFGGTLNPALLLYSTGVQVWRDERESFITTDVKCLWTLTVYYLAANNNIINIIIIIIMITVVITEMLHCLTEARQSCNTQ